MKPFLLKWLTKLRRAASRLNLPDAYLLHRGGGSLEPPPFLLLSGTFSFPFHPVLPASCQLVIPGADLLKSSVPVERAGTGVLLVNAHRQHPLAVLLHPVQQRRAYSSHCRSGATNRAASSPSPHQARKPDHAAAVPAYPRTRPGQVHPASYPPPGRTRTPPLQKHGPVRTLSAKYSGPPFHPCSGNVLFSYIHDRYAVIPFRVYIN